MNTMDRRTPPGIRKPVAQAFANGFPTDPPLKKITIRIDASLHRRLRNYSVNHDVTITKLVTTLVEDYLDREGGRQ